MANRSFHYRRIRALLAGVSLTALLAAAELPPALAGQAPPLSPAALANAAALHASQVSAAQASAPALGAAAQAQAALSVANLARAALAFKNITGAQAAAAAASQLTASGQPLDGLQLQDAVGANGVSKDVANKTATVDQTARNALLDWSEFDLYTGETLVFDQKGNSDWSVLNRIVAGNAPSKIFGKIEAPGTVYIINRNGVIFGGSSQINVHSLVASSLDVGLSTMTESERNGFFLNNGITPGGNPPPLSSFAFNQDDTQVEGDIKVEAGATITTSLLPRSVSPDAGGYVYLFGPNVENDGTISTPAGETLMVAAQAVELTPNAYFDAGIGTSPTFRAVGVNTSTLVGGQQPPNPWRTDGPASAQITSPGQVTNTGLIDAERGVVILNGDIVKNGVLRDSTNAITQAGVIRADTGVTRNGQIFLDGRLQLTLDEGTSIQILPDENGETIPRSATSDPNNFKTGLVEMQGNTVDLESGALVEAPGSTVQIAAKQRIISYPDQVPPTLATPRFYMAPDAAIDVSGLMGVLLPMSANLITFKPFGNEFADSPLQRDGALVGQDITIDIREGTPLADVSGLIANVPLSIDQLLTTAGTVGINAGGNGDVILRQGSSINVAGGYVQYEGGEVATTNLVTADGRIVNIANASPLDTYTGIAGVFTLEHPHWGPSVSESFVNPLLTTGTFDPGYIEGRDAGGITLNGANYALDGNFYAGVVAGERQRLAGKRPSAATANTNRADPSAMPSAGFLSLSGKNNLVLQKEVVPVSTGLGDALPADRTANTRLGADSLTQAGFAKISANFTGSLTVEDDADLTVAPGGSIALSGGSADVEGRLTAHSGSITVEASALVFGDAPGSVASGFVPTGPDASGLFDLTIGAGAVLDASGQWVNDAGAGPDALTGGAYVDAGSITLKTDVRSAQCGAPCAGVGLPAGVTPEVDLTGSIVLADGSLLDVSSGGRIDNNGKIQIDSLGRPAGKGGSVSLLAYSGLWSANIVGTVTPTVGAPKSNVIFAGSDGTAGGITGAIAKTIHAFGFAQGGALSIQAPSIQIGGIAPADQIEPPDPGLFYLPESFFDGNAFGGYNLTSVVRGLTVVPGADVALRQRNFIADPLTLAFLPTGGDVADIASVGLLPDILRSPTDLKLAANASLIEYRPYDPNNPVIPYNPNDPAHPVPASEIRLSIGDGAVISGDPGAAIGIAAKGRAEFSPDPSQPNFTGSIAAQTAVADVEGSIIAPGGSINLTAAQNGEAFLGAHSLLDASGTAVFDSRAVDAQGNPFRAGKVLPGGSVSVSAGDAGSSIVGLDSAMIDVSGAAGTFDLLPEGAGQTIGAGGRVPTLLWSDAGSINISGFTVLYDGGFRADPGAADGAGGGLSVFLPGKGTLAVQQDGGVTAGLTPTNSLGSLAGNAFFFADALAGSGISSLTLSGGTSNLVFGDDTRALGKFSPGTIQFNGNVDIAGLNDLFLDATVLSLANVVVPTNPAGCNVCLGADYVALRGGGALPNNFFSDPVGPGVFRVDGNTIDIAAGGTNNSGGALSLFHVAEADFVSSGDIRLRVPLATVPPSVTTVPPQPSGELLTMGNLTLQAAQIYPVSDVDFTLKSLGANSTITFLGNGPAAAPALSAGGSLTVSAAHIDQEGILLAPLGTIRLGAQGRNDLSALDVTPSSLISTQSVTLGPNSLTSVSLIGLTVPFGETTNGKNWSYNSQAGSPLGTPPAKDIAISGASIDQQAGATVDISGGGDIQAMEFVRGTGGSHDVLAGDPGVFAIIPGYNPAVAPIDFDFLFVQGDAMPPPGASVFLSGGNGLPAGFYTLLPAHYATLPGAYRVSIVPNTQDALASNNIALPDGTARMAGYFANSVASTRDARNVAFDVQSGQVWRLYSEIDQTSGNAFFGAPAPGSTAAPPRLPSDAGHLSFSAVNGLNIAGLLLDAPDVGGRGSQVDIAAIDIQILSPGGTPDAGFLTLDPTQLTNLGANSLMIGGIRSGDGATITPVAHSVEVSNDAADPLEAPAILLVTGVHLGGDPPDPGAILGVMLDDNSVIRATGDVATGQPTALRIGDDAKGIHGEGSLLAVSTGAPFTVDRQHVTASGGIITIGAGATVEGGNSLLMDSTGNIGIDPAASFAAPNISIGALAMTVGNAPGNTGFEVSDPAVLSQLEQAQTLTLYTSRTTDRMIRFFGDSSIVMAKPDANLVLDAGTIIAQNGGNVHLAAGTITFVNSNDVVAKTVAGNATLQADGGEIVFAAGDKRLGGFASATFAGSKQVAVRGTGSLDAGAANLTFQTPRFLVGAGADQTLTTKGTVAFAASGANAPTTDAEIGGTLTVNAAAIQANTLIQAIAGGVSLHATSGNITLGSNGEILANGFAQTFFDTTRVASGGMVQLIADAGNIETDAGSQIDVSSAAGRPGDAGTVELIAENGTLGSDGGAAFDPAVIAGSVAGDSGGTLQIDVESLGTTSLSIPSLFSDTVQVRVKQGELDLAGDLAANTVTLTADTGVLSVDKTIDASGAKGGSISLFGGQGVTLGADARLLATASDSGKRGGDIVIGTEVAADNGSANDGVIDIRAGSVIDVSNTQNPANGGTVRLRAPLDATGHDVAINAVNGSIVGASSVTVEAFKVFTTDDGSGFNGVIDPTQGNFYTGTLVNFIQNFSLSPAATNKFAGIAPDVLHLQPGIELVNNDPSHNGGDITVAKNWNLGAGTAGFLENATDFTIKVNNNKVTVPAGTVVTDANGNLLPQYANYKGDLLFVPGTSQITKLFYRVGGSPTGEAGTLTLRASRDLVIDADITDGFFQTQNRLDTSYRKAVQTWISKVYFGDPTANVTNVGGLLIAGATASAPVNSDGDPLIDFLPPHELIGPLPSAPYDGAANSISPADTGNDHAPVAGADLFPLIKDPNGPIQGFDGNYRAIESWSYNLVAGSDTASANPLSLRPLSVFADGNGTPLAGHGNVVIDGHTQFSLSNLSDATQVQYETPTIVRTGTGSIDIAAARDFIMADTKAPGVVYTAGRSNVTLPDPHYTLQVVDDPLNPGGTIKVPVAQDPTGFLSPQPFFCDPSLGCQPYGPITAAAYPVDGGHLTITVQQDILGFEHPTVNVSGLGQQPNQQYFAPWLYAQSSALADTEFGIFSPLSAYVSGQNNGIGGIFTPSQTSWWINFGSFDQGVMSVGGDIRIVAGRDINQLGVSLPTTARMSGGLSNTITDEHGNQIANLPVLQLNKSGDLTVVAGRDILSGAYYEGSGDAQITAGRSVAAGWQDKFTGSQVSTVLAVDTGAITLRARSSLDIAGVVSAVAQQNVADSVVSDTGIFVSSYGPASDVSLQSVAGNVTVNSLTHELTLINNGAINAGANPSATIGYAGTNSYPANFEAVAMLDDVRVADSLQLAASDTGQLDLLAFDSLRIFNHNGDTALNVARVISTGPSLVEGIFDPTQPLAGFGPDAGSQVFDLGAILLHQNDPVPDLFYAVTGDIVSGAGVAGNSPIDSRARPISIEVTKPAEVRAGRDIVDLPFFGENLAATDVTQILAGRDIFYTGAWLLSELPFRVFGVPIENDGGLSLAGPGFFDVEAGRNLGPFVTPQADIGVANNPNLTADDPFGNGIITFGNTVVAGNRLIPGNRFALGANFLLPREGANIVTMFGVGKGADYQSVLDNFVNPATGSHSFLPNLVVFLQALGLPAMSPDDAWATFNTLSPKLQHAFVDEIFFSELLAAGTSNQFSDGYAMINTLFPASLGYTDNGPNGAGPAQQVATGDLEMLHATIKTVQSATKHVQFADGTEGDIEFGGDVMVLGPGGGIDVGALTTEVNKKLTNSAIGLLTLDNGGLNVFTDGNVLVNQSRVLTVQGGDVLMWSSNGDLDAGRGAKTSVDFKPLSVNFDPNDLQTINLNGLVSGAGIGTIQSTPDAPRASVFLFAPRGTINFGDAGVRSTGNAVFAALQFQNQANVTISGAATGIPQETQVNLGALESAGSSAGEATKTAEDQAGQAANRGGQTGPQHIPSLITVEVLGFGECDPKSDKDCN